jgi:hypothetical protein
MVLRNMDINIDIYGVTAKIFPECAAREAAENALHSPTFEEDMHVCSRPKLHSAPSQPCATWMVPLSHVIF